MIIKYGYREGWYKNQRRYFATIDGQSSSSATPYKTISGAIRAAKRMAKMYQNNHHPDVTIIADC